MKPLLNLNLNLNLNLFLLLLLFLISCSPSRQLSHSAKEFVLDDESLRTAHVGISIYEPATGKYLYNYQGDKYFVPASNTKLPTCYAAMKYLGDSLVGLRYEYFDDSTITIYPTGDPSFMHPDFKKQPVLEFLKKERTNFYLFDKNWKEQSLGSGWAWNDYGSDYMAERSAFPIYGNLMQLKLAGFHYQLNENRRRNIELNWQITPSYFKKFINDFFLLLPEDAARKQMQDSNMEKLSLQNFAVQRKIGGNELALAKSNSKFVSDVIPFFANHDSTAVEILRSEFAINIQNGARIKHEDFERGPNLVIHSQPTDSVLKPMMHRSDNFFAEQSLLMVSNELLGLMNDEKIIDTLLKTDFKDLPQKPVWVDGCGLSRYNLFSPQDMVYILNKMRTDFGMERIKNIFATGNTGTLSRYYVKEQGIIFAKTGTLSGVVALSGFLYTKKNRLLIFSVLVNNHTGSATAVRRAVEKFVETVRNKE